MIKTAVFTVKSRVKDIAKLKLANGEILLYSLYIIPKGDINTVYSHETMKHDKTI